MRIRPWTPQEYGQMATLWLEGKTPHQIAKHLARGSRTIKKLLAENGLTSGTKVARLNRAEAMRDAALIGDDWPKKKACIGGCGRTVIQHSRNDYRKCHPCRELHAELSHLEGVDEWAA